MRAKLAAALLIAGAVVGFALLVAERLNTGDVYEAASSLRTGREGTSVLFEALQRSGVEVSRNYQQPEDMDSNDSTILLLGLRPGVAEAKDYPALEVLAGRGNRVVIALDASAFRASGRYKTETQGGKDWNIRLRGRFQPALRPAQTIHPPERDDAGDDSGAPDAAWPLCFEPNPAWDAGLKIDECDIAIKRTFGKGSVTLIADTQPYLNGALRDDRDSPLLKWTVGDAGRVVFVESHLGSVESGSVMGLIRRMHLEGVLLALALAAMLFYWRASVPFPPLPAEGLRDFTLPADGAGAILVNLLERRVQPSQLMAECASQWERDCGRRAGTGRVEGVKRIAGAAAPIAGQWEEIRETLRGIRTT